VPSPPAHSAGPIPLDHADAVGRFYDEHADAFQRVYGDVIQAFRTTDVRRLLDYEAKAMGLAPGMKLLDAGCGVGGPALYFAEKYGVRVDGITMSGVQARLAAQRVEAAGLGGQVAVRQGDYHAPGEEFERATYDVVCFLESLGHSHDKGRALDCAWEMLAPGGRLYIKDLFVREPLVPEHEEAIAANIRRINEAYHYFVGDLYDVLRHLRRGGFILSALKTVDIALEDFEDLTISNEFQELTGIHAIDDLGTYHFPVDFFELIAFKPPYDKLKGNNRDFLQNLLQLKVHRVPPDAL
jgi:SAM-dependent methyltransferase